MKVTLNSDGIVSGFPHHDGKLTGVRFVDDSTVEIVISPLSSDQIIIVVEEIELMHACNFKVSNIIDGFYWVPFYNLGAERKEQLSNKFDTHEFERFMKKAVSPHLLEIAFSYGPEIYFLTEGIPKLVSKVDQAN